MDKHLKLSDTMHLKDAVFEYVSNNPMVNSVDIVLHFKLRSDVTLHEVGELEQEGKIRRVWGTNLRYRYMAC